MGREAMIEKTKLVVGDFGGNEIDSFIIIDLFKEIRCAAEERDGSIVADVGCVSWFVVWGDGVDSQKNFWELKDLWKAEVFLLDFGVRHRGLVPIYAY